MLAASEERFRGLEVTPPVFGLRAHTGSRWCGQDVHSLPGTFMAEKPDMTIVLSLSCELCLP